MSLHISVLITVIGEYYLGYFRGSGSSGQLSVILINKLSDPIRYTVEAPVGGLYHSGYIDANSEVIISLPLAVAVLSTDKQYKGVYIITDNNAVSVTGQNEASGFSETFLAIPYDRSHIVTEYVYYAMSFYGYTSSYQSAILIVGTEDRTTMKLTVTQTATTNYGNTLYTGRDYFFVINRLQTFYIRSTGDLTGTRIFAYKQLSVFSGHEGAQISRSTCCSNPLIEQIPPVTSWGRVFYTMPLATRSAYDIRILASHDSTYVVIYCSNLKEFYTINEGQYYSKRLSQEYCVVHSNKPVLVAQFSHGGYEERDYIGDPMMMIVPDTLQYSNKFYISTIRNTTRSDYKHYVNLVLLAQYYRPDMIHLISGGTDVLLNDAREWVPIRVNNIIEAYSTELIISEGAAEIIHTNKDALMALNVYGSARLESYGHPGRLHHSNEILCKYIGSSIFIVSKHLQA